MNISIFKEHSKVCFKEPSVNHAVIQLEAPKIKIKSDRKPINLVTTIDTSTSMYGDKLKYAKKSLMKLIDNLTEQDTLAIIEFNNACRLISSPVKMTSKAKEELKAAVGSLKPVGATNFSGALTMAIDQAKQIDGACRIVMFTDGQPTVGECSDERILDLAKNTLLPHISVTGFGYGKDHNAEFLTTLASAGKGNYAFIEGPEDALTAFARELGGLLSCHAQDIKVRLNTQGRTKVTEVLSDLDVHHDDDSIEVKIPDIYSEEKKNILVKMCHEVMPKALPRDTTVMKLQIEYMDVSDGQIKTKEAQAKVRFVKSSSEVDNQHEEVKRQLDLAKVVKAQIEAERAAKKGNFSLARDIMGSVDLRNMDAQVASFHATNSTHYNDSSSYTNSTHLRAATMFSYKGGRGSVIGTSSTGLESGLLGTATNTVQQSLTDSFLTDNSDPDEEGSSDD